MNKRIIPLLLCLVLALAVVLALPGETKAATAQETGNAILQNVLKQDGTFPATLPEGQTTTPLIATLVARMRSGSPLPQSPALLRLLQAVTTTTCPRM